MTWKTFYVQIQGTTPLIQNAMTQKAMEQLSDPASRAKTKEKLTPREQADLKAHVDQDGNAVHPCSGIYCAMATAAKNHKFGRSSAVGKMTAVRFTAQYARLMDENGKPIRTWEVESAVAQNKLSVSKTISIMLHYPRFDRWRADFHLKIHDGILSPEFVHQLLTEAGELCGIGTMRPERGKGGCFGTFQVVLWEQINGDEKTSVDKIKRSARA